MPSIASALRYAGGPFKVHLPYGFSSIRLKAVSSTGAEFGPIEIELNLRYIAALLALAFSEPSRWSIDRWHANTAARRQ
jgi:putative oxidoreductase